MKDTNNKVLKMKLARELGRVLEPDKKIWVGRHNSQLKVISIERYTYKFVIKYSSNISPIRVSVEKFKIPNLTNFLIENLEEKKEKISKILSDYFKNK